MRKDSMPQNETREITDSDLENVSGGILGTENLVGGAQSALPTLPPLGGSFAGGVSTQIGPISGQAGLSGGIGG